MDIAIAISKRDTSYIKLAAKLAGEVTDTHKHGCVILKGGRIIATGRNMYYNGVHAEIHAFNKLNPGTLKGAIVYIARLRKQQKYGLSRPCPECEEILRKAGVMKIIYTTNNPLAPICAEKF
jgi:pyrimidine deaminase RibD-like protein